MQPAIKKQNIVIIGLVFIVLVTLAFKEYHQTTTKHTNIKMGQFNDTKKEADCVNKQQSSENPNKYLFVSCNGTE